MLEVPWHRSKLIGQTLKGFGIRHIFTRPHTPKTNWRVGRFSRTYAEEWPVAGRTTTRSSNGRALCLAMLLA